MKLAALCVLALLPLAAASGGDEHFEFEGVFPIADDSATHTWSMQKVGGAYADPAMMIVMIPAGDVSTAAKAKTELEADEAAAEALAESNATNACPVVNDGDNMNIAAGGSCYMLTVDATKATTLFTINATGLTAISIFTAHMPTEFEATRHYLYSDTAIVNGTDYTDIEPQWTGGNQNAMFTCTKNTVVNSAQTWQVRQQTGCNHDCSVCTVNEVHTTDRDSTLTGALKDAVCMEEDHCEGDPQVCEKEYIMFHCKDEADGVHVDMHVFEGVHEGTNVTEAHCGDDNYRDTDEYVEYESGVCGADGHGHHTHGEDGATNPVEPATPTQSDGVAPRLAAAAVVPLLLTVF